MAPVLRKVQVEVEEIIETSSQAFQFVIAEGGEEVASLLETVFSSVRFLLVFVLVWRASRKAANAHGCIAFMAILHRAQAPQLRWGHLSLGGERDQGQT